MLTENVYKPCQRSKDWAVINFSLCPECCSTINIWYGHRATPSPSLSERKAGGAEAQSRLSKLHLCKVFTLPAYHLPREQQCVVESTGNQRQQCNSLSPMAPAQFFHFIPFTVPSPVVAFFFFSFNMQVAMKNLLMKYLLRSLLWARLITYLCLSLASHILNTHLLSV